MKTGCGLPVRANPLVSGQGTTPGHWPCNNTSFILLSVNVVDPLWLQETVSQVCLCIGYVCPVAKNGSLHTENLCIQCSDVRGGYISVGVSGHIEGGELALCVFVCPSVCPNISTSHKDTTGIIKFFFIYLELQIYNLLPVEQ